MRTEKPEKMKTRRYRRSTPVGRLRHNAQKVLRYANLVRARISSWSNEDPRLSPVLEGAASAATIALAMDRSLEQLEKEGFAPVPRSSAAVYREGDHVAVVAKHVGKYTEALAHLVREDPDLFGDLVVDCVLTTGELSLRRGRRVVLPVVPRSHVAPVEDDEDEAEGA